MTPHCSLQLAVFEKCFKNIAETEFLLRTFSFPPLGWVYYIKRQVFWTLSLILQLFTTFNASLSISYLLGMVIHSFCNSTILYLSSRYFETFLGLFIQLQLPFIENILTTFYRISYDFNIFMADIVLFKHWKIYIFCMLICFVNFWTILLFVFQQKTPMFLSAI